MSPSVRFELKMDADEKCVVSRAAALMGTTMAGFARAADMEKAQALLEHESGVTLSKRDFAAFEHAPDGTFASNRALKGALARDFGVLGAFASDEGDLAKNRKKYIAKKLRAKRPR